MPVTHLCSSHQAGIVLSDRMRLQFNKIFGEQGFLHIIFIIVIIVSLCYWTVFNTLLFLMYKFSLTVGKYAQEIIMDKIWSHLWLQTSTGEDCLKAYPLKQRKSPVVF